MLPKRHPSMALAQPHLLSFWEHIVRGGLLILQGLKGILCRQPENYRSQNATRLGCFGLPRSGGEELLGSVGPAQAALRKPKWRCA